MKSKPKNKIYFSQDTEDAIIEYNNVDNIQLKNKIYQNRIKAPFEKLAESIINTFKFPYFDSSKNDIQSDVVSVLFEKLNMFKEDKGKAFSYFSIIAKNYLILNNNLNYKRNKEIILISMMPENWDFETNTESNDLDIKIIDLILNFWNNNLNTFFSKKKDIEIALAILELFHKLQDIENFKKNDLYTIIRTSTNCKTKDITKVIKEMKSHQKKIINDYLEN